MRPFRDSLRHTASQTMRDRRSHGAEAAVTSRPDRERRTRTKSTTTEGQTDTQVETLVETDRCPEAAICRGAYG